MIRLMVSPLNISDGGQPKRVQCRLEGEVLITSRPSRRWEVLRHFAPSANGHAVRLKRYWMSKVANSRPTQATSEGQLCSNSRLLANSFISVCCRTGIGQKQTKRIKKSGPKAATYRVAMRPPYEVLKLPSDVWIVRPTPAGRNRRARRPQGVEQKIRLPQKKIKFPVGLRKFSYWLFQPVPYFHSWLLSDHSNILVCIQLLRD